MIKRVIAALLILTACGTLSSCKVTDSLAPVLGFEDDTKEILNIDSASKEPDMPFAEGYYTSDDHVLHLIYTGNTTEYSYGVSVCDKKTGEEEFFGLAYNIQKDASSMTVPGYYDTEALLKLSFDSRGFSIRDISEKSEYSAICGNYKYYGTDWSYNRAQDVSYITPGIYRKDSYKLTVEKDDEKLIFTVTDADQEELFTGVRNGTGDVDSVTFSDGQNGILFTKGVSMNVVYIEVAWFGHQNDCPYEGKFILEDNSKQKN